MNCMGMGLYKWHYKLGYLQKSGFTTCIMPFNTYMYASAHTFHQCGARSGLPQLVLISHIGRIHTLPLELELMSHTRSVCVVCSSCPLRYHSYNLHSAFTLYTKVSLPPMLNTVTLYLPRTSGPEFISVSTVWELLVLIAGPVMRTPSFLHSTPAGGLPWE